MLTERTTSVHRQPGGVGRRRSALLVIILIAAIILLSITAFRRFIYLRPPSDDGPLPPSQVTVEDAASGFEVHVGRSVLSRRQNVWIVNLHGDAREQGHAGGILLRELFEPVDRFWIAKLGASTGFWSQAWDQSKLSFQLSNLLESIPPWHLAHMAAFAQAVGQQSDTFGGTFQRIAYLHALRSMPRPVEGLPSVRDSAFAVWGRHSVSGHVLAGRLTDVEDGTLLREHQLLSVYRFKKRRLASVTIPGFMGVVAGVNDRRLFVSLHNVASDWGWRCDTPPSLIARQVLEQAQTIEEAVDVVRALHPSAAFSLMVVDAKLPDGVVIEVKGSQVVQRRPEHGAFWATNHLAAPAFSKDARNDREKRYTSSGHRFARLGQLVRRFSGRIDPETAALILRNRTGLDDSPLALGHRAAIDSLIAVQATVFDLSAMVVWMNRGPATIGPFTPIDLKPMLGIGRASEEAILAIPPDQIAGSPELERFWYARKQLAFGVSPATTPGTRMEHFQRAVAAAPEWPQARFTLANALWKSGRTEEARKHYRAYIGLNPVDKIALAEARGRYLSGKKGESR